MFTYNEHKSNEIMIHFKNTPAAKKIRRRMNTSLAQRWQQKTSDHATVTTNEFFYEYIENGFKQLLIW